MRWAAEPRIPEPVRAVLAALAFDDPSPLPGLSDLGWQTALAWCDRFQLTLLLRAAVRQPLPGRVEERLARNLEHNRERHRRLLACWDEVSAALSAAGIEAAVLKGFAHWRDFVPSPEARVQYDLDLYAPHRAAEALAVLQALGYAPLRGSALLAPDHLAPLRRPSAWSWSGDFFDPEIPIAIELHHRLWNPQAEGFSAPGVESFWDRRDGWRLDAADNVAYASLHVLRHILRGDTRPAHVYELAWFLHARRADDAFWTRWRGLHDPALRRLQAAAWAIAAGWFAPRLHPAVREELDCFPEAVRSWAAQRSPALVAAYFHPNKEEIGLYRALADSAGSTIRFALRRLLPVRAARPPACSVDGSMPLATRARRHALFARYCCGRAWYHARALASAADSMTSSTRRW